MPKDLVQKYRTLGDVASRRDPRRAPWGYYASDDGVFGAGLFFWFNTKEGLLQFLAEYEGSASENHDQSELRPAMRKIANRILVGRLGFEKGRLRFNKLLQGHIQIEWLGHFDEMLSGKHPFCTRIRAEFLGIEGQSAFPAIAKEDVKEFIEELRSYGH